MAPRLFLEPIVTSGDAQAQAVIRKALAGHVDAAETASCLFEIEAMYVDGGQFLAHAASIAAEAMSNPDPSPALALWAALLPEPVVTASSMATTTDDAWSPAPSPTIVVATRRILQLA